MRPIQRPTIACAALAAVLGAGCGGGQGGALLSTGAAKTSKAGDAVITYFGQPKPMSTSTSGPVSVVAQAGATFSTVTLEPPPNLLNTYVVWSRNTGGLYDLDILPWGSPTAQPLYQTTQDAILPAISSYGTIAFAAASNSDANIFETIRPDGTGLRQLSFTGVSSPAYPQYSFDGTNRISFNDDNGTLYIAPGSGGNPTVVQTNCDPFFAVWNPAGTQLAYSAVVASGFDDIFLTATSGGASTDITPSAFKDNGHIYPLGWNVDGTTILGVYRPTGSNALEELVRFNALSPSNYQVLTPSGDEDLYASFSPDGSKIVFYRTNAGGATPGIYVVDTDGENATLLAADPTASESGGGIAWSPFLPKETVIGSTGSTFYHQAASGFLLSQSGSQFGSLVAFTANTPADAAIQSPPSATTGAPLIYTLTADSITSIGYINSYFNPGTTINLTSTPSAVVTVDGTTGQVDLVAPAALARPALSKNSDGTITYTGSFKALYDGTGKNLAPRGVSTLTVNPNTGKLVSFK